MPDFFEGKPAPMTWMPMPGADGREPPPDEKALDDFVEGPGNTESICEKVLRLRQKLQTDHPGFDKWGLVGYCWGGYVSNFLLGADSPFSACAELHPGFPGKEQAQKVSRPILALCSKDEPQSIYAHFKPHLQSTFKAIHFPSMVHGWMSARGDLYKVDVQREFQQGYELIAQFFAQRLA